MLTLHQIRILIKDRQMLLVERATGVHRGAVKRIRDGDPTYNPRIDQVENLSNYLQGELKEAGIIKENQ